MRIFITAISWLILSSNTWAADFALTGVVKHSPNESNILIVNGERYQINSETRYDRMMRHNEFGPIFEENQLVGFNTLSNQNEYPLITEIWILDNE